MNMMTPHNTILSTFRVSISDELHIFLRYDFWTESMGNIAHTEGRNQNTNMALAIESIGYGWSGRK
jgi:hypothetical protein